MSDSLQVGAAPPSVLQILGASSALSDASAMTGVLWCAVLAIRSRSTPPPVETAVP